MTTEANIMEATNDGAARKYTTAHFQPASDATTFITRRLKNSNEEQRGPEYSRPPFHKIRREDQHIPRSDTPDMSGVPLHASSPIYDNNWRLPPSPPHNVHDQASHDTTRSRLADEHLVRSTLRSAQRGRHAGDIEYTRTRKYRRRSPHSDSGFDDPYEARRYSRGQYRSRGRSHNATKAINRVQPSTQQIEPAKTGLEAIITPLRLGILLGCFDIIGGSLSVWMTRKRFGKGAQQVAAIGGRQQQQAKVGEQPSGVISKHPRRSTAKQREELKQRYHPYDSASTSETDSEYEERQRRTAEHVRQQRRLDHERHGRLANGNTNGHHSRRH